MIDMPGRSGISRQVLLSLVQVFHSTTGRKVLPKKGIGNKYIADKRLTRSLFPVPKVETAKISVLIPNNTNENELESSLPCIKIGTKCYI